MQLFQNERAEPKSAGTIPMPSAAPQSTGVSQVKVSSRFSLWEIRSIRETGPNSQFRLLVFEASLRLSTQRSSACCPSPKDPYLSGPATTSGTMFPTLCDQYMGSLTYCSSFTCGDGDKDNGLTSLPK